MAWFLSSLLKWNLSFLFLSFSFLSLSLSLSFFFFFFSRWFLEITEIVSTTGPGAAATLFRGRWMEKKGDHPSVLKPIYVEGDLSDWHTHLTLERVVLRHHCCSKDCQVTRTCDAHPSGCHLQCETATIKISHAKTGEFLIDEHYRTLSSWAPCGFSFCFLVFGFFCVLVFSFSFLFLSFPFPFFFLSLSVYRSWNDCNKAVTFLLPLWFSFLYCLRVWPACFGVGLFGWLWWGYSVVSWKQNIPHPIPYK